MIASFTYDPEKLELRVTMNDGRIVVHRGVPSSIAVAFETAQSQPDFYSQHIREQFPHV